MKNHRILYLLAALLLCLSCTDKAGYSGIANLQGKWYPVDSQGLVSNYVEFSHGYLTTYRSDWLFPAKDGVIWNCPEYSFTTSFCEAYSVIDGCLVSGHQNFGPVSVDGDLLHVGDLTYRRLEKMDESCYSSIQLPEGLYICPTNGGSMSISASVVNPVAEYNRVEVSYCPQWVLGVIVGKDWVQFTVGALDGKPARRDSMILSYPFSEDAVVYLEQK